MKELTFAFDKSMYWWKENFEETVMFFQKLGFDVTTLNSDEMHLANKSNPLILFSDCMTYRFGLILKQLEIHSESALVSLINPVSIDGSALDYAFKSRIFITGNGDEKNGSFTIWDWDKKDIPKGLILPYLVGNFEEIAYLMGADFESLNLGCREKDYVWGDCLVFDKHDVFIKKYNESHVQQPHIKDTAEYLLASFYAKYQRSYDLHELVESLANQNLKDFDVETIVNHAKSIDDYNTRTVASAISHLLLGSGLIYISKVDLSNDANTRYSFYDGVVEGISSRHGYYTRKAMLRLVLSLQGYKGNYYNETLSNECLYLATILSDGIHVAQQLLDDCKHLSDKDFAIRVSGLPLSKVLFSARKNNTNVKTEWLKLEFVIAKKLLFVLLRENPVKYKKYLGLVG